MRRSRQKQKKRAKAALDPDFTSTLPPSALHLDYMSSEYSSAGPDTDSEDDRDALPGESNDRTTTTKEERRQAKKAAREQRWAEEVAKKVAALGEEERENWGAFGFAQGEKVLEIRCPRWRSQLVSALLTCAQSYLPGCLTIHGLHCGLAHGDWSWRPR